MRYNEAVLAMVSAMLAVPAFAQNWAVGLWKKVEPNKVTMIRTYEEGGHLLGKVEKVLKNDVEDKDAKCAKCKDDNKDKPMAGLQLIWDMRKDGDKWTGGNRLDPETRKAVNCKPEAADAG